MDPIASPEPERSTERREIVVSYSCLNMRGIRSRGKPSVTTSRATFLYRHSINYYATEKLPWGAFTDINNNRDIIKFINKIIFSGLSIKKKQAIRLPKISFEIQLRVWNLISKNKADEERRVSNINYISAISRIYKYRLGCLRIHVHDEYPGWVQLSPYYIFTRARIKARSWSRAKSDIIYRLTCAELICPTKGPGMAKCGRHWPYSDESRRRLDEPARSVSPNGRIPSARREMIEYLISRTMGNQRRHTASLLAVQSVRSVRPSVCLSVLHATRGHPRPPGLTGPLQVSGHSIREYSRVFFTFARISRV